MKRSLNPDRLFKANLLKKLNVAWDNTYNVKYAWHQTVWFKHATGFASVVLMAGSLGAGAYAYTSPQVTEGNVLYPIKQNLEKIEEIAQITPEAKAKFYLKKIERREEEKVVLKKKMVEIKKIEKVERSIEQTEDKLEQAGKIIEKIDSKDVKDIKLRAQVKERLKVRVEKRQEKLEKQLERKVNRLEKRESSRRVHQESD